MNDSPGPRGPRRVPESRALPPPSPAEWRRLEPLVDAVLDAAPAHRAALVAKLSGGDAVRRAELERLVAECEEDYPLLERPAVERFASVLADQVPPMPGMLAGRYQVVREAGRGGMAIVYLARDVKHGRDVAIKVVRPELAAAIGRQRFLQEIEIAAGLRHPHIVPLYDSGEVPTDGESDEVDTSFLYYVMPYEAGHSLRARLEHDGPLPVEDVVLILRDVCEALAHAHHRGIVHRDIKPDNVLLSDGHALVTDFGVARAVTEAATRTSGGTTSTMQGTPAYMAPEQRVAGVRVDRRADVYAVGVLAYELLAGRPPTVDDGLQLSTTTRAFYTVVKRLTSLRPDVPETLAATIAQCLAERPNDRWQNADALLVRLGSITNALHATPNSARARADGQGAGVCWHRRGGSRARRHGDQLDAHWR